MSRERSKDRWSVQGRTWQLEQKDGEGKRGGDLKGSLGRDSQGKISSRRRQRETWGRVRVIFLQSCHEDTGHPSF